MSNERQRWTTAEIVAAPRTFNDRKWVDARAYDSLRAELEEARKDIQFLSRRAELAGSFAFSDGERATGVSSNAIVRLAYGGAVPSADELPMDIYDLRACERAFQKLPEHRKTDAVKAAMQKAYAAIDRARGEK